MLRHAHSGSLWLSLALSGSLLLALALSGSLLLSEFAYNILARLTKPLLSSQRRCCAATLYAALLLSAILYPGHFIQIVTHQLMQIMKAQDYERFKILVELILTSLGGLV